MREHRFFQGGVHVVESKDPLHLCCFGQPFYPFRAFQLRLLDTNVCSLYICELDYGTIGWEIRDSTRSAFRDHPKRLCGSPPCFSAMFSVSGLV